MHLVPLLFLLGAGDLGTLDFPVTASQAEAKTHFLRGVLALHSFWYEEADEEFRESTRLEPGFAMGYWGEAMTHNHPIWEQQDAKAGREALAKVRGYEKASARERGYIDAVKVLYGEGDKAERDAAYARAMEKLSATYPDDAEAKCFYSLALMGKASRGPEGLRERLRAGALALEVFAKNQRHPGAAHYIIHAFDDPDHAILALPAARRYAEIAPAAHHARHMPSHIFVQLGMWREAAASNESAWETSSAWATRKKLPITKRDYHSLSWLIWISLEQGQAQKARKLLETLADAAKQSGSGYVRMIYAHVALGTLMETDDFSRTEELYAQLAAAGATDRATAEEACSAHAGGKTPSEDEIIERGATTFARALADARGKKDRDFTKQLADMRAVRKQAGGLRDKNVGKEMDLFIEIAQAEGALAKGGTARAIETMRKATVIEDSLPPPSGPAGGFDSHERLGEMLLAAKKPGDAASQFMLALGRHPLRARSLLGAARAAAAQGDRARATAHYQQLLAIWQKADADWPALAEVRSYLAQANSN